MIPPDSSRPASVLDRVLHPDDTPPDAGAPGPQHVAPRALAWLGGAALVVVVALLLRGPSEALYVALTARTGDLPWTGLVAEGGVLVLLALCGVVLLRSRHDGHAAVATTLTAGVGAVLAYGASELVKSVVRQPRGCWELVEVAHCPAPGDWSFPSNHTAIAFALAAAVVVAGAPAVRSLGGRTPRHAVVARPVDVVVWVVLPVVLAVSVGVARVAQGAHFPHDVVAGAAVGVAVVVATTLVLGGPATAAVHAACRVSGVRRLLVARPW
ncbi:phosphatase PAP2 family protein [Cellulosimicrobium sp. PMB13]|uniref:phosphatase PAP2 family protein n=1 Tax=Cellulosimicrobium sp. PMB13 TaxID=3120158 RepID=UPI003F4B2666